MANYDENLDETSLQYISDMLFKDEEIQYVKLTKTSLPSSTPIDTTGYDSIFTKLKEYPYEFEINSSLRIASVEKIYSTENKIDIALGDRIKYKNNTFKIVKILGNTITLACIPDSNTPTLNLAGWQIFQTCENSLNTACRNYFKNEELGITAENIYNARKTDYDLGWLEKPTSQTTEYWLSSGYLVDGGKAIIYLYYYPRNANITGKLMHTWAGASGSHTLSICPIITCESRLIKIDRDNNLYIE